MDLDNLDDYDIGQPMNEPMTEGQRMTIYKLIANAILTPDQKEGYRNALDCHLTFNEAEELKQELREIQLGALQQYKPYEKEVNAALKKLVNRPNN